MKKSNGQFVRLTYQLLDSQEWREASRLERDIYVSMRRKQYKRNSRGKIECTGLDYIPFGHSDMIVPCTPRMFVKGIEGLRCRNLIQLIAPGGFNPKKKAVYAMKLYR